MARKRSQASGLARLDEDVLLHALERVTLRDLVTFSAASRWALGLARKTPRHSDTPTITAPPSFVVDVLQAWPCVGFQVVVVRPTDRIPAPLPAPLLTVGAPSSLDISAGFKLGLNTAMVLNRPRLQRFDASNLHTPPPLSRLNLGQFAHLESVSLCRCTGLELVAVQALARVRRVRLTGCKLSSVAGLGRQELLDISHTDVEDVSMLGGVRTLKLVGCNRLTDFSALGRVRHLDVSDCQGLTDLAPLRGVHELHMVRCLGATDARPLGQVHTLNIQGCTSLQHMDALRNHVLIDLHGLCHIQAQ